MTYLKIEQPSKTYTYIIVNVSKLKAVTKV